MIYNEDCVEGSKKYIDNECCDLLICDSPFGINETLFDKHYKRDKSFVLDGYVEAPEDYYKFSVDWLEQAKRIMKPNASLYVFSGWTKLLDILAAIKKVDFFTINHLIWKFNFGVATKTKYVSSHYHILYLKKTANDRVRFNTYCRFGSQERDEKGGSLNYKDLEDVFVINKDYLQNKVKNENKLPDTLIEKLILYSSIPGDVVGDFFLGNFTTAMVAKRLGRIPIGFEINKESFEYYMPKLEEIKFDLASLKQIINDKPKNQGKKILPEEIDQIWHDYQDKIKLKWKKKDISEFLCEKYGRGKFSIKNILDKLLTKETNEQKEN